MLRELAYDVCGMPIVNYMSAREHGLRVTAVPIFPTRRFLHGMLVCDRTVVTQPTDLEGRRVGIGYYGNTDSTWVRGLLSEYGVDLDRITWVTSSEEQVLDATLPPNVEPWAESAREAKYTGVPGGELDELLLAGEVAGVIYGRGELVYNAGQQDLGDRRLGPLFDDVEAADLEWLRRTRFFPMMTVVVVRDSLLVGLPDLPDRLQAVFTAAKERALERARTGVDYSADEANAARISGLRIGADGSPFGPLLGPDPLPYGVDSNRAAIETIARYAHEQRVLQSRPSVDELFAPLSA
jgi:4,5-dihydroxyphthalate decarboxylase